MAGRGTRYAAYGCSGHGERAGWLVKVAMEVASVSISVIDFTFQERIYVRIRSRKIVIQQSLRLHLVESPKHRDVRHGEMAGFGRVLRCFFRKARVQHVLEGC